MGLSASNIGRGGRGGSKGGGGSPPSSSGVRLFYHTGGGGCRGRHQPGAVCLARGGGG